jgi:hypothetical protein
VKTLRVISLLNAATVTGSSWERFLSEFLSFTNLFAPPARASRSSRLKKREVRPCRIGPIVLDPVPIRRCVTQTFPPLALAARLLSQYILLESGLRQREC